MNRPTGCRSLIFGGRVASGFGCPETQTCYPTILTESILSNSRFFSFDAL